MRNISIGRLFVREKVETKRREIETDRKRRICDNKADCVLDRPKRLKTPNRRVKLHDHIFIDHEK